MTEGPLAGIAVLDLTRLLPGGYATLLLADLGADVVKVEQPGKGDYVRWTPPMVGEHSAGHIALNRNKRSITLDLKRPEARDVFLALAAKADVVVESFRPGVMDRLGLGWEVLRDANPRLVYCAISGYGQDGPRATEAGHDIDYMAYTGALSIMGEENRGPTVPGLQIGDLGGGGMAAVIAILTALYRRNLSGEGDFCDISMSDGVFSWLSIHAAEYVATGTVPERGLMPLSGRFPCYRVYPAADGWLAVGALEPQFWAALCEALERPDLIGDAYASGRRKDQVVLELEELFETRTRAEWMERFAGRDVCVAPVNDFEEAFRDPQVLHRGMLVEADLPGRGSWRHVGNPIKLQSAPGNVARRPPPGLGEHTTEVLAELGLDENEVERLRGAGAI